MNLFNALSLFERTGGLTHPTRRFFSPPRMGRARLEAKGARRGASEATLIRRIVLVSELEKASAGAPRRIDFERTQKWWRLFQ
jgi:hypothetical protein